MTEYELYQKASLGPWRTTGIDVQYRIEYNNEKVLLFFQFTTTDSDWKENLKFWITSKAKDIGFVHTGFYRLFYSSIKTIDTELLPLLSTRKLIISGISEGSALAVLAHLHYYSLGYTDVETYAFACPCVVWRFFIKDEVFRSIDNLYIINRRGDLVPFSLLLVLYKHIGKVIKIGPPHIPWWTLHTFEAYEKYLDKTIILF